jgi:hypothetical protein
MSALMYLMFDVPRSILLLTEKQVYSLINKEADPGVGALEVKEIEVVLSGVVGCDLVPVLEWFL